MKNVTIALDDEVHRQARIRAAELGTSLSALVKDYLNGLAAGDLVPASGVHEMPMPFKHAQPIKDGPPWFINGKWSYTPDGKPRQPGALRKPGKSTDLPETPDWLIEAMEHWDEDDFDPIP
jgi:hypothetical protein